MAQIKITLKKSTIGAIPKHRKTVQALGLRKINSSVVRDDIPAVRGMIHQVSHLLSVEAFDDKTEPLPRKQKTTPLRAVLRNVEVSS